MDLQQLRQVQEVARCGSISRAAKNLYMSQPNLSKSIRELEEEIGVPLFHRTVQGMEITLSGEQFLQYAHNILTQMDQLTALYQSRKASDLNLSVCVPRASYIAQAFNRWAGQNAEGRFHLLYQETNTAAVLGAVTSEEAQVGIVRYDVAYQKYYDGLMLARGLNHASLWEYNMLLLMHRSHPLSSKPQITPDELEKFPEIVHGDLPSAPPAGEKELQPSGAQDSKIEVFDRAGQFGILRHVPGSYIWVSPVPQEILDLYQLVQIPCTAPPVCRDTAVWKGRLSASGSEFLDEVRCEIEALIHR